MGQWHDDVRRAEQLAERHDRPAVAKGPLALAILGFVCGVVLIYVGPMPGVGLALVLTGLAGAFMVFLSGWVGP